MKLYLGNAFDAKDETNLNKQKINTIICLAEEVKIINPNITIYKYNLQDSYECNISLYFDEICDLIHKQDGVLINCVAGISRSSSFVIAYLMKYYEMNLQEAFLYVRKRRNIICPNKQFMTYLYEYEFKIFGENSLTYDECVNLFYYTSTFSTFSTFKKG
jgi:protein-tyrosine phosphatase